MTESERFVPTWLRALGAVGAGALLVLAFPPYGVWPLSVFGVTLLVLAVGGASLRMSLVLGLSAGLVFFLGLMPWLRVIGIDAWLALSSLCAVFFVLAAIGMTVLRALRWWPLWIAFWWVLVEALRERVPFGGFPWGRLAFANSDSTLTGWVAIGGAPLLSFFVALCGSLLAGAAVTSQHSIKKAGALAALALVVALTATAIPRPTDGRPVNAAVVQGNVPRTGLDAFGQREAVLRGHVDATLQLAAEVETGEQPQPDLVIWPENASDIDPVLDPAAYDLISEAVNAVGVPTLVGIVTETEDGTELLNSGVVWSPQTGPGESYVKRHPVPFGEYIPFRSQLAPLITRFDRIPRDFARGGDPGVLTVGPAVIGDVICFEVAFNALVRDVVDEGAEIVTVQTNNATYGGTGQVEQQLAISQLRAVEHGRSVLVAATSGISAIIEPDGRIVERSEEFTQVVLVADVPARTSLTLATRMGAWPELALSLVAILAFVQAARVRRRGRE